MKSFFGSIYERGAVVFHQGEPGNSMYIIQSGAVEVSQCQGKQDVVLTLLERGDFFGEMAQIDQQPRSATVRAIHRARLLPLTRSSIGADKNEEKKRKRQQAFAKPDLR